MNTNETYYSDLMTIYFSGETTPEQVRELSVWLKSDVEHAAMFAEFRKSWLAVTALQVDEEIDVDQEWGELQKKIPSRKRRPETTPASKEGISEKGVLKPLTPILEGPPAIEESGEVIRMEPEEMEPEGIDWRITLIRAATIAAIVLVLLVPTWMVFRYFTTPDSMTITATNELMETKLPDGTLVTLNAFASISYSEDFGNGMREVELNGEGYFDVAHDSIQPFIISKGDVRVEVLGTSFYINTMKNGDNVEVVLVEGSLSLYFEGVHGERKTIIPGEKAELFQANQRIMVSQNDDPNFLAWKTRRMIFLDDRLDFIVNTLNKIYQAEISLASEDLAACRLTASFNQQSLESVLSVIQTTLDLSSETSSSEIILFGQGCN